MLKSFALASSKSRFLARGTRMHRLSNPTRTDWSSLFQPGTRSIKRSTSNLSIRHVSLYLNKCEHQTRNPSQDLRNLVSLCFRIRNNCDRLETLGQLPRFAFRFWKRGFAWRSSLIAKNHLYLKKIKIKMSYPEINEDLEYFFFHYTIALHISFLALGGKSGSGRYIHSCNTLKIPDFSHG